LPQPLPDLNLTLGQVLWALNHGREPDKVLQDQVRYLRQLGIPQKSNDQAPGSGNRIRYDFHDLVELGLGLTALRHRFKPKDISTVLHDDRVRMRNAIELAWTELPETAIAAPWVKSHDKTKVGMGDELFLRMHERHGEQWGKVDLVHPNQVKPGLEAYTPIEIFEDGEIRVIFPIKALILPWVAWALEAPATRTGPK